MKPNQFYAGRVPVAASEPNYTGSEPARRSEGAREMSIARLLAAIGLAALLGFALGPAALIVALITSGAALMLTACLLA